MTVVLAIIAVQLAVAGMLFGTRALERPAGEAGHHPHPFQRLRRRIP